MTEKLKRITEVCDQLGKGRATIYEDIGDGTMTPPIRIGVRWSAWPASEVDAIVSARVAGCTDEQIQRLVKRLVALRLNAAPEDIGEEQRAATAEAPRA